MRGIIEGFYGSPWTWEMRALVSAELVAAGMDTYVYAPKDDPLHREQWRTPYGQEFLGELGQLAAVPGLRVGFAVSPGLSLDPGSATERSALLDKLRSVIDLGVDLVGIFFDDLPPGDGLGHVHGEFTTGLRDALPEGVDVLMAPLHYTGVEDSEYLRGLRSSLDPAIDVIWTGREVVNDSIAAADAREWSEVMGRRPVLWDNTPVNDAIMSDRLFPGPLAGRDPDLPAELAGYLANPMVQAAASVPALLSAAAWLRGDDPLQAWQDSIGEAAVLSEAVSPRWTPAACDRALAGDRAALTELSDFFGAAVGCTDGGFGQEVEPWVRQVREEAGVAQLALTVLEGGTEAAQAALVMLLVWPAALHGKLSVFGGRGGTRPALGQDAASEWVATAACQVPAASIVDRLVTAAFGSL